MGKVTSKLQVTLPKAVADRYGIRPGDEVEWVPAGDRIHVVPHTRSKRAARATLGDDRARRLRLFDQATARQRARERLQPARVAGPGRGWRREDLYDRGRPR